MDKAKLKLAPKHEKKGHEKQKTNEDAPHKKKLFCSTRLLAGNQVDGFPAAFKCTLKAENLKIREVSDSRSCLN